MLPAFPKSREIYAIMLVGLVVLASIWFGVSYRLATEKAEVLNAAHKRAGILADALLQHTKSVIHSIDLIALIVKREYERSPSSISLKSLQNEGFYSKDTAAQVSIVDAEGRILQSTIPYAGGVYVNDREHFKVHRRPDVFGLFIGKPVLGRVSRDWTVQLTRRLDKKNGDFAGIVVVSEEPRFLTDAFLEAADLGRHGQARVLMRDGQALSVGKESLNEPHRPKVPEMLGSLDEVDQKETGANHLNRQVIATRSLEGYPIKVQILLDRAEVLLDYGKMRLAYIAGAGLLSMVLLVFVCSVCFFVYGLAVRGDKLKILSETDSLTGLPNRHGLICMLEACMARVEDGGGCVAVLYIDLSNLKRVNDMLGHGTGDQLLKKIADRLKRGLEGHMVGRFGGDEFLAIIMLPEGNQNRADSVVYGVITELIKLFEVPVCLQGNVFDMKANIGVSVGCRKHQDDVYSLIREADQAMYMAKNRSGVRETNYCYYTDSMREEDQYAAVVVQCLRSEMEAEGVRLMIAPVQMLADAGTDAFWVLPFVKQEGHDGKFLGRERLAALISHESGLLRPFTEAVLKAMLVLLRRDRSDGWLVYSLSVGQFLSLDCAEIIQSAAGGHVEKFGFVLEVPEQAFLDDPECARARAGDLCRSGVKLVLGGFSGSFLAMSILDTAFFVGVSFHKVSAGNSGDAVVRGLDARGLAVLQSENDVLGAAGG